MTDKTPFRLTYRTDPIEVEELSWRTTRLFLDKDNVNTIREEVGSLEEKRIFFSLVSVVIKQAAPVKYNK